MARCLRRRAQLGSQAPSRQGVSMRVFGLVLVAILASVPASAQVRHPMGTVDVTAGPVACDGQECYDITVSCPEVSAPARARLKVGGTPEKGTILFTTGADGTVLYEIWSESRRILDDIRTVGFQSCTAAVDRQLGVRLTPRRRGNGPADVPPRHGGPVGP